MSDIAPRSNAELHAGIRHLGYEFEAMMAMPALVQSSDCSGNWAAGTASLEAFLVHTRTFSEFFFARRRPERMHREDYLPGWAAPSTPEAISLRRRTGALNAHLAHLHW